MILYKGVVKMADYMKIIMGIVGVLVVVYMLQAALPLLFSLSFNDSSIWGTFGAAILPVVFPLVLAAVVLVVVLKLATGAIDGGNGGEYGL